MFSCDQIIKNLKKVRVKPTGLKKKEDFVDTEQVKQQEDEEFKKSLL